MPSVGEDGDGTTFVDAHGNKAETVVHRSTFPPPQISISVYTLLCDLEEVTDNVRALLTEKSLATFDIDPEVVDHVIFSCTSNSPSLRRRRDWRDELSIQIVFKDGTDDATVVAAGESVAATIAASPGGADLSVAGIEMIAVGLTEVLLPAEATTTAASVSVAGAAHGKQGKIIGKATKSGFSKGVKKSGKNRMGSRHNPHNTAEQDDTRDHHDHDHDHDHHRSPKSGKHYAHADGKHEAISSGSATQSRDRSSHVKMGLAVVFAVIGFASAVAVFATYMGGSSHSVQQAGYAQLKGYVIPPTGLEQMSENVATESIPII